MAGIPVYSGDTHISGAWQGTSSTPAMKQINQQTYWAPQGIIWAESEITSDTLVAPLSDFRYIRTTLYGYRSSSAPKALAAVTGNIRIDTPDSLLKLKDVKLQVGVTKRSDSGTAYVMASDTNGTFIPFNLTFIDIDSIVMSPDGSTEIKAVPSFVDTANPTGFYGYLYDANGARVSGTVRWNADGVTES